MMKNSITKLLSVVLMATTINIALAEQDDFDYASLSLEELLEVRIVTIATGTAQKVTEAAAVTSVITARDIEAMGATDLDEILESVPGLHVARNSVIYSPIYTIRGIYSEYNPEVLVLVNGLPINTIQTGNRGLVWGGMPVKAISRIEVIRGPGSAVYGADAFSGVINIITKKTNDINGTEAGVRAGSFNTKDVWVLHGESYGDV
ncbi:MAG: TonB-dependent receptor plug domain-containing protein, partial [Thiotrichaceae bacterium]|nr:TonB-dependent receptor plug domain-containing protein [Thiotrichaceae bacterium]